MEIERYLPPQRQSSYTIDLLVSGGGYATFYETRFLGIPAKLESFPRLAEDIGWRLRTNSDYEFEENGADQFVRITRDLVASP